MSGKSKSLNAIDIAVGSRIRMRRLVVGLSQSALGEAVGVTFQQVQKYERGVNRVGASRLQAIAQALTIPVTFFFQDRQLDDYESASTDGNLGLLLATPESVALNRAFLAIGDSNLRKAIISLIEIAGERQIEQLDTGVWQSVSDR